MSKNWEVASSVKKMQKFLMLQSWKHSITSRNYAVTYYKTLEDDTWHLGLKKTQELWKVE